MIVVLPDGAAHILSRVKQQGDCWIWQGARIGRGYGKLYFAGRQRYVHRFAYEVFANPIPDGMYVLHRCDVRLCCNPRHLFLGTHQDNMADMVCKGRQVRGDRTWVRRFPERVPRGALHHWHGQTINAGEANGRAKLTAQQVLEIKDGLASGKTCVTLAAMYAVSQSMISNIRCGRNWKCLEAVS